MIPKYEVIAADIRRSIEDGTLKPGEKLPTVVEFCDLYGVSKITVRRAIERMTEDGLVTSRRGSGTYVKEAAGMALDAVSGGRSDRAGGFTSEHQGQKVESVGYDFKIVNPPAGIARLCLLRLPRARAGRHAHRHRVHVHAARPHPRL